MDNLGLISIIVPVYNVEEYLERCVESILEQEYKYLEIILVDDGSTDKSGEICDSYADKDGRIKVVHKRNGGLSDARNAGLAVATGKYIGYVDSDDWIEPDMYSLMITSCEENSAQLAICRYREVYSSDEAQNREDYEEVRVTTLTKEEALDIYISNNSPIFINNSVWSKLFRRDIAEELVFPVGHKSEDIVYTTKAMCNADRCVYVDKKLYNYELGRAGSIMSIRDGERMLNDEIPFWRQQAECLKERGYAILADKSKYYFYRRLLFYFIDYKSDKNNTKYADKIVEELRKDKAEIKRVYRQEYVATGDKFRMFMMRISASGYYMINNLYEKCVIPLKRKVRN